MNAAQGATSGEEIGDGWSIAAVQLSRTQDKDLARYCLSCGDGCLQQSAPVQRERSLVAAHTHALAAGKNEASEVSWVHRFDFRRPRVVARSGDPVIG